MKLILAIVAAAVVAVAAMYVMQSMGAPMAADSPVRPAIAGGAAGFVALIVGRKTKEK